MTNLANFDSDASAAPASGDVVLLEGALEHAEAALEWGETTLPASFSYHWRGLEIDGIVERHGDAVRLSQAIGICVLPYSAEDAGERARIASFLVRAPNRTEGRFSLGPGQEVVFVVQTPVAQPINGPRLAAACVQGALAAMPHLDVFRRSLSGWVPDVNASRSSAA